MKSILLAFSFLALSGCATVHEQCMKPSIAAKYRDYDQCYAERSAEAEQRRQAWSHMGDGLQNASRQPQRQPTSCVTTGMPGMYTTNCN
jgi:uncharacterized protein YceK